VGAVAATPPGGPTTLPAKQPGTLRAILETLGGVAVLVVAWQLGGWIVGLPWLPPAAKLGFIFLCAAAAVFFFLDGLRRRRKERLARKNDP